jgi:dissimilatory sulfite reductase (desulfoviridin) alpha/beta subunit
MPLYEKYVAMPTPKHFKIAIAGCPKGCTDPYCADLGIIATGKGSYDLFVGGKGGTVKPQHAKKVAAGVPEDKVEAAISFIFEAYKKEAEPKEKFCNTIERVGLEKFIPPQDL